MLEGIDEDEVVRKTLADSGVRAITEPEDVARLVAFLVSAEARQIQGAVIRMDGGANRAI